MSFSSSGVDSSSVPSALYCNSSITDLQIGSASSEHLVEETAQRTMFAILDAFMHLPRLSASCNRSQNLKTSSCPEKVEIVDKERQSVEDRDLLTCCGRILPRAVLEQIEKSSMDFAVKARLAKIWISGNERHELFRRESLDFSRAGIQTVPMYLLSRFRQLKKLDLAKNHIFSIPEEFGLLSHLQQLSLSSNFLSRLPSAFGKLREMRELFVNKNQLRSIPQEMENMVQLTHLGLWDNSISFFPLCLTRLPKLEYLDLTDNILCEIPDEIGHMTSLKNLGLKDNTIARFSTEVYTKLEMEANCQIAIDEDSTTLSAYILMVKKSLVDRATEGSSKVSIDAQVTSSQSSATAASMFSSASSSLQESKVFVKS